jgi:hypothetical protein
MNVTFVATTDEWGDTLRLLGVPPEASATTSTVFAADYEMVDVYDASEGQTVQVRGALLAPGRYLVTLRYPLVVDAELAASILAGAGYGEVTTASE